MKWWWPNSYIKMISLIFEYLMRWLWIFSFFNSWEKQDSGRLWRGRPWGRRLTWLGSHPGLSSQSQAPNHCLPRLQHVGLQQILISRAWDQTPQSSQGSFTLCPLARAESISLIFHWVQCFLFPTVPWKTRSRRMFFNGLRIDAMVHPEDLECTGTDLYVIFFPVAGLEIWKTKCWVSPCNRCSLLLCR